MMAIKVCSKCKEEKSVDFFANCKAHKDGYRSACRICTKIKEDEWRIKNSLKLKEKGKRRYAKEKDVQSIVKKKDREDNPEKYKKRWKQWHTKNREFYLARRREKYNNDLDKNRQINRDSARIKRLTDPLFKLKHDLRVRVYGVFKYGKFKKNKKTEDLLGVDFPTVKKHIEKQFTKGMNWENHGSGEGRWQIDHKIPLASAKTEEELVKLCHYTNLQPLWAVDNKIKRDKILEFQLKLTI